MSCKVRPISLELKREVLQKVALIIDLNKYISKISGYEK